MKLSKAQIRALKELSIKSPQQRGYMKSNWVTIKSLAKKDLVIMGYEYCGITPAGIAALEEAERENGIL